MTPFLFKGMYIQPVTHTETVRFINPKTKISEFAVVLELLSALQKLLFGLSLCHHDVVVMTLLASPTQKWINDLCPMVTENSGYSLTMKSILYYQMLTRIFNAKMSNLLNSFFTQMTGWVWFVNINLQLLLLPYSPLLFLRLMLLLNKYYILCSCLSPTALFRKGFLRTKESEESLTCWVTARYYKLICLLLCVFLTQLFVCC